MSTPTAFRFPTPPAAAVAEALNEVLKARQAETPELDCFADIEHDYKYDYEVDRLRNTITDAEFHKIELEFYHSVYIQMVHDKLLGKHKTDGQLTLDGLRGMKASYKRILAANGLTSDTLRRKRLEITDQNHWKPEAELIQQIAPLRENDRLTEFARHHAKMKLEPGSRETPPKATRRCSPVATRTTNTMQSLPKSN